MQKLGTYLWTNLRYITLTVVSLILLLTAKVTEVQLHEELPPASLGQELVHLLYDYDSLEELSENHSKRLSAVLTDSLINRYALDRNRNRIQYAYDGLEKGTVRAVIHQSIDGYIEFSVSVDGIDDNLLRGIWYQAEEGKIYAISEADIYPFPTNQKEGDAE